MYSQEQIRLVEYIKEPIRDRKAISADISGHRPNLKSSICYRVLHGSTIELSFGIRWFEKKKTGNLRIP